MTTATKAPTRRRPTSQRGLTFNPHNHQYRLDGEWVPGVTTIIGVLNKEAIPKWAAERVASYVAENPDGVETLRSLGVKGMVSALKEIPWKQRDDAADRGVTIHDYADVILRGEEADVVEELVPVVENAIEFMDDWQIEPLLVEVAIGHRRDKWAGTADLFAKYRRPDTGHHGIGVFDWKSGKALYPEFAWQFSAYGHGEFHGLRGDEHPLPECDASFGVHIRADGYDVAPFKYGPDIYDEFLQIRRAYDIAKRGRGNWKVPGSGHLGVLIQKGNPE